MPFDFFTEYCRIHRAVYGRDPCTREQWERWCRQGRDPFPQPMEMSDIEFDMMKEREGDAQ